MMFMNAAVALWHVMVEAGVNGTFFPLVDTRRRFIPSTSVTPRCKKYFRPTAQDNYAI